jgi:hypothetical protein
MQQAVVAVRMRSIDTLPSFLQLKLQAARRCIRGAMCGRAGPHRIKPMAVPNYPSFVCRVKRGVSADEPGHPAVPIFS